MRESFKEYICALGRWGWVLVADILNTIVGIVLTIAKWNYTPWIWLTLLIVGLAIAPFIAFHKMRVERDKLLNKAKPKLKFKRTVKQIRGRIGESFCLEISNQGSDLANACQGTLIAVEFAIEQKRLSMSGWPVNQPLAMKSSIGGGLSSTLEVIHKEPSSTNGFGYHFAYEDNANKQYLGLCTEQDILIIIGISSLDASPLYTVCIFRGLYLPGPTKFEIVGSNLEECPTIEQCRQMLAAHNAKTETQ